MEVATLLERKWVWAAAGAGAGVIVGFTAGYILASRKKKAFKLIEETTTTYELGKEEEEDPSNVVIDHILKEPEFHFLLEDEKKLQEAIDKERVEILDEDRVVVYHERVIEWDFEREMAEREGKTIYVIHQDEFMTAEADYQQQTVTYYSGDDIMADERDAPIYNYQAKMGELHFGHGSGDPDVVYIRNDNLREEWEVLLNPARYEVEVGGLELETDYEEQDLKHSALHKFREE